MCWTAEVSFALAAWQYCCAYYFWKFSKYEYRTRFMLSCLLFGTMELAEGLNWSFIEPFEKLNDGECNVLNKYSTIFSFLIICLQPIAFNYGGYIQNKVLFQIPLFLSIVYAVMMLGQMFYADYFNIDQDYQNDLYTVAGNTTCSYHGPNDYILWKFKFYQKPNMPNFSSFMLFGLPMLFYKPLRQVVVCFGGFSILALVAKMMFPTAESVAFWCGLTAILPVFMLIDSFIFAEKTKVKEC